LFAFIVFVVLSSGAAVAIRATYVEVAPFWAAAARFLCGALIFWVLAYRECLSLPTGTDLWGAVLDHLAMLDPDKV
jgi:hypothetical protein